MRRSLRVCAADGAPRRFALVLVATTFIVGALPALADACTVSDTSSSQVFKQFLDPASYVLVPGGTFEDGTSGWKLDGATVVNGNESYYVNSTQDTHSLWISPGGSATSTPICTSMATPTFRFFARQTSGSLATLKVNLLWSDGFGVTHSTTASVIHGGSSWEPTPSISFSSTWLPMWVAGGSLPVSMQFVPAQGGGAWEIDDVYADPYAKGL